MLVLLPSKTKPKYSILFFIGCLVTINLISIILFYQNLYIDSLYSSICGTLIFTVSLYFRYLDENSIALENEKKQLVLKKEREIGFSLNIDRKKLRVILEGMVKSGELEPNEIRGSEDETYFSLLKALTGFSNEKIKRQFHILSPFDN